MHEMSDHELALMLQLEYDTENSLENDSNENSADQSTIENFEKSLPHGITLPDTPPPKKKQTQTVSSPSASGKISIIDPSWELLDPSPDIHALFIQYNAAFFWGKLAAAEVRWSPRMTLCAGLCCYQRRGGYCSIRLSAPLLKLRPRKDLVETLLHEMIHAFLFLTNNNKDHDDHGPEFKKHMNRINQAEGTNISVYHSFHDEVDAYRQHWWRCDGPCKQRKPFYGWVKRSMNRAPSARDTWWQQHQQTCGGTFTKVKEPEGYKKKGEKKKEKEINNEKPTKKLIRNGRIETVVKPGNDIRSLLGNDKKTAGGRKNVSAAAGSAAPSNSEPVVAPSNSKPTVTPSNGIKESKGDVTKPKWKQSQEDSARVLDNIGTGLGRKSNIKSVGNLLNLTNNPGVGTGVGRSGNIHSVGKFLKGESTKDGSTNDNGASNNNPNTETAPAIRIFKGSGNKLGGSGSAAGGCRNSRLLNLNNASNSTGKFDNKINSGTRISTSGTGTSTSGTAISKGQKRTSDEHEHFNKRQKTINGAIVNGVLNKSKALDNFVDLTDDHAKTKGAKENAQDKGAKSGDLRQYFGTSGLNAQTSSSRSDSSSGTTSTSSHTVSGANSASTSCYTSTSGTSNATSGTSNATSGSSTSGGKTDPVEVSCPACGMKVQYASINEHLNTCLS